MTKSRWGLLAVLLLACGGGGASTADGGNVGKKDAGSVAGADAGAVGSADAASPGADAGTMLATDAGAVAPSDAGALSCRLEAATSAIKLSAVQQQYELADLAAGDGDIAVAYAWNQTVRKLKVVEAATGKELSAEVLTDFSGASVPKAMDYAGGLYFVAGNMEDATGTLAPYLRVAYYNAGGYSQASGKQDGFLAMAAAREKAGGRVLAWGKPAATGETPVTVNRFDLKGGLVDSTELSRNARKYNDWDLEWRSADDTGMACGLTVEAGAETLAVWPMDATGSSLAQVKTSVAITSATTTEANTFGCRISLGDGMAAVAVADGVGGARLVWFTGDGAPLAGPVPFSSFKRATRFDVAVDGAVTALAHLDESKGTPRVAVKVFPSPAGSPIELFAEADLNLGAFDLAGRKVRLVRAEGGFAVAFDANIKLGQTDLYVRRILCQ